MGISLSRLPIMADDRGPMDIIIPIGMLFILLFWLGQTNSSLNFLAGNSTIAGKYCCASTSAYGATSWLLWIVFSPFALLIFVNYLSHRMRQEGEGDIDLATAAEGDEGSSRQSPLTLFQQAFVHRRRVKRSVNDLARLGESEQEDEG